MKKHLKYNPFIYFASSIIYQTQKYLRSKFKKKDFKIKSGLSIWDGGSITYNILINHIYNLLSRIHPNKLS